MGDMGPVGDPGPDGENVRMQMYIRNRVVQ